MGLLLLLVGHIMGFILLVGYIMGLLLLVGYIMGLLSWDILSHNNNPIKKNPLTDYYGILWDLITIKPYQITRKIETRLAMIFPWNSHDIYIIFPFLCPIKSA